MHLDDIDIAVMQILTICSIHGIATGILILIGRLEGLKEAKTMDMIFGT